jgi:hypothetical protein
MFDAVGLTVSRLARIRFGPVALPRGLVRGRWVELGPVDVAELLRLTRAAGGEAEAGVDREDDVAAAAALVAVAVSVRWPTAAVIAVLLTVAAVVLARSAPMPTALAGLAAAAYLVLRHNEGRATPPTAVAAVAFALTATAVVALPTDIPWLPLAAPVALLAGYVVTLRPFSR